MLRILLLWLLFLQADSKPIPAIDVKSTEVQNTLGREDPYGKSPLIDTPLRTANAGAYNISIAVVHRAKGAIGGAASHDSVAEVYQVLDGSGTLVTGGTIVNSKRRSNDQEEVRLKSGPGISGSAIEGGVSRYITKGDIIVIPAGTPHWFSEVRDALTYTVVRIDQNRVLALK